MAFVLYRDYALMQRDTVWVTVKVIMTDFYPNLRAQQWAFVIQAVCSMDCPMDILTVRVDILVTENYIRRTEKKQ